MKDTEITRRHVLAVAGVSAVGGLAGCVNQVAARTTNTAASPAAMFGGVRDDQLIPIEPSDTIRLSPTVRVEEQFLSGDVEIEAWMTNSTVAPAQDYNSVRSNKRRSAFGPVPDGSDDDSDTIDARKAALELERQLLLQTQEVLDISKRSARTGRNPQTGKEIQGRLDEILGTIDKIIATLARCGDNVCETVRSNAEHRKAHISSARGYFEHDQQYEAAEAELEEVRLIVERDIELLESSSVHDTDSEVSPGITRLKELTGANDDEIRRMYEYLDGEPVLSERCVITLPDARVPRGGPALEELITPNRVIQFVTGRADGEGTIYAWGKRGTLAASDDDNDDDESCEQSSSGTHLSEEGQVYCWGSSSTGISGPVHTYGGLEVVQTTAGVGVINTPPVATDEKSKVGVASDGQPTVVDSLEEWGSEDGPASSTSTIVCQVLVQPAGCPCPFPALLHVQRHKNNDQYIYSCGWVIDESCLYTNSTTVVTSARGRGGGAGKVSVSDIRVSAGREITGDMIRRLLPDDISPIGSQMFSGHLDGAVRSGILPDDEFAEEVAQTVSSDGDVYCSCYPLDGHCLHLVDDGDTSNTVKFKSGAELSKSVN